MPSAAVDAAFQARLAGQWTGTVVGINGIRDVPSGTDYFLVVQYPVVNSSNPTLGPHFFEEGAARLVLNVKSGLDLATVLPWADTLAGLFRLLSPADFDGVETFTPSAPIINDANDDGNWFELAVIVPYRYQFNA